MKPDFHPPPGWPHPENQAPGFDMAPGPDDASAPLAGPDAISFEQIRERAYELWERNHRPEGFEIEFWLLAERELRKERERRKAAHEPAPSGLGPPSG